MAGDQEGAARRAQEGVAVSSGDSSAPMPKPALDSDGATLPGVNLPDITAAGNLPSPLAYQSKPPSPNPKDSSDAVTIVGPAGMRPGSSGSGSPPHPIFANIGATVF